MTIHNIRMLAGSFLGKLERKMTPDVKAAYRKTSFSRSGEDLILKEIFDNIRIKNGLYIDIGANHPFRCSNTALFDQLGWYGICIEPNSKMAALLRKYRKNCRVVESAVSAENGFANLHFYEGHSALGSTSRSVAIEAKNTFKINAELCTDVVPAKTLTDILNEENVTRKIDLLDIDVEGGDFEVLTSLDFNSHRPKVIIIETTSKFTEINQFLTAKSYREVARVSVNQIFIAQDE